MKVDTILAIGSTPIDFTKAGILLLAERGKLSLDDPITKYFDKVPDEKKAITLKHLMTGRSGLQDFHDVPEDRDPDHGWIDRAEAVKPHSRTGTALRARQGPAAFALGMGPARRGHRDREPADVSRIHARTSVQAGGDGRHRLLRRKVRR